MSAQNMTLDRLRQILAAYGGDPDRWPDDERDAAEALIAASPVARDALAQEQALDAGLSLASSAVPDDAMARLTAAMAFPPPRQTAAPAGVASGWFASLASAFWPRATVFASMAALGIIVGLAVEPVYSPNDANASVASDSVVSDYNVDVAEDLGL